MAKQINDRHYTTLAPHERFVLMVAAMRRDEAEADRLEATCPHYTFRAEDQAFRERMRRAYMIASWVALSLEGPLAQIRLAKMLHDHAEAFSGPVSRLAQLAFLYGREYGKWEAGVIDAVEVPEAGEMETGVAENPDLQLQLTDLAVLANETVADIFASLRQTLTRAHVKKSSPKWCGFGRFCHDTLGIEPLAVMKAFGLMKEEPEDLEPGLKESVTKSDNSGDLQWTRNWNRRFNRGGMGPTG